MMALKKTIAYTHKWKHTVFIALLLGMVLPLLLITLEPFDTSNSFSYKYLILSGYAFCITLPILLVHPIENYTYKIQSNRWFIINECVYIFVTLLLILVFSFFYHFYVVSGLSKFNSSSIFHFIKTFGLPFIPLIVPLWLYLRSKYGVIEVPLYNKESATKTNNVTIYGDNKTETLTISESDFIYAQAQQNYVDLYYKSAEGTKQKNFRSTLSNIMRQLPNGWQVHRSYLVNLDYLISVEGNSRKRYIIISNTEETIPISQKYYDALSKRLSKSSQLEQF
ncbi:LytTR family DNA-binding domain-containing protein [Arcticibacterium luteifluviistationis]|uniref:HTH LytTR-type domain-containing protein n=1 Tax=Arcticibacterium luteifluviistationis TaxID=1784714 RepID=A0A2Z4G7C8_9BACT|nr:LytTR family DNA-binding domain-containing protein [Arcticibacterium luteifluviistationis]AWV97106.1 hypothetical protein DJ013_02520 [Arcticibacterium luteifluviistationis]